MFVFFSKKKKKKICSFLFVFIICATWWSYRSSSVVGSINIPSFIGRLQNLERAHQWVIYRHHSSCNYSSFKWPMCQVRCGVVWWWPVNCEPDWIKQKKIVLIKCTHHIQPYKQAGSNGICPYLHCRIHRNNLELRIT